MNISYLNRTTNPKPFIAQRIVYFPLYYTTYDGIPTLVLIIDLLQVPFFKKKIVMKVEILTDH